jgi:hypothetical protein
MIETWLAAGAEREVIFSMEITIRLSLEALLAIVDLLKTLLANK